MLKLTQNEQKVLKMVCDEKKNAQIALKMDFGVRSVEKIKARLFQKSKTKSSLGLFKWALANKLYTIKKLKKPKTKIFLK